MVWLYRSPLPVGGEGYFTLTNDFYLPSLRLEEGGGFSILWLYLRVNLPDYVCLFLGRRRCYCTNLASFSYPGLKQSLRTAS
jgi:hypothetical protein